MSDQTVRILLVEDNPLHAKLIQRLLDTEMQLRCEVVAVDRLADGLRHAVQNPIGCLLRELTAMFLAEYPKLMAAIDAAHASGNTAELRRAAHTLKGSAQVIGAGGVGTAAQRL
ncbi:response regulator, partial [Rhizobium giardinii]|uniref:response regulator n=1 Tax=Rhizobium giardinii TaxID=56731 RepID=UPI00058C278F